MRLWKYPEFAKARCLIPIAYHQFDLLARASAWSAGIEFHPIVTEESVARNKNNGLSEGHGSVSFLTTAVKRLTGGGTVLLAPTATRTSELSMPKLRPTDMLLNAAYRKSVPFAVLFTGYEINGVTSYESAAGMNILKNRNYTLHTGRTLRDAEILVELEQFRDERKLTLDPRRPFDYTDQWLFETQLPSLVAPAYLPKSILA